MELLNTLSARLNVWQEQPIVGREFQDENQKPTVHKTHLFSLVKQSQERDSLKNIREV
jgi:hypothetical protein